MKRTRKILLILALVVAVTAVGIGVYAGDYYRADAAAAAALVTTEEVAVAPTEDGLLFRPRTPRAGFIFYPGGKVEHTAYAPLMRALAQEGILCVLTDMPLNLAVLDMNAAEGIPAQYPEISRWSIGGHSLGGAMAASYAAAHAGEIDALILLAAYSTAKLPEDMTVISLYGTKDLVMDRAKYEEYRSNLPAAAREIILEGGNHAQFGSYGPQSGDGDASMPAHAQLAATVEVLREVLLGP